MTRKEIEEQAERVTSLFSYRNGYSTPKDAFISGAEWMQSNAVETHTLGLTWKDVKKLLKIEGDLLDEELELKAYQRLSHKKFCQELLKRFNEQKNK